MKIYSVIVDDRTNLGGRMGTETTPEIDVVLCLSWPVAVAWFGRLAKKHGAEHCYNGHPLTQKPRLGISYDFGHVGIRITGEQVKER